MDPISALAMVGTCAAIINQVIIQIRALCNLYEAVKGADVQLMSLVAQLNTMRAALHQIQTLMEKADYDNQLQMDLDLALQACTLLMQVLETKVAKMKVEKGASTLKLKSKLKVIFDSKTMGECLTRLDHQAGALTLLITVLTSKSVTEQKMLLQRSHTRKVFRQLQSDTASIRDLQVQNEVFGDAASVARKDGETVMLTPIRSKSEQIITTSPWKRFGFDRQLLGSKAYSKKRGSRGAETEVIEKTSDTIAEKDEFSEEAETLVHNSHRRRDESLEYLTKLESSAVTADESANHPPFSKMLAFGHEKTHIPSMIAWAQGKRQVPADRKETNCRLDAAAVYKFKTRDASMSIRYHCISQGFAIDEDFFASHQDASSILFAVNFAHYCCGSNGDEWLSADIRLFDQLASDYHLSLARIVLFLDNSGLETTLQEQPLWDRQADGSLHSTDAMIESIRSRFLQAGRMGASLSRISVHVGEPDEAAACTIFASMDHTKPMQSNKWSGLTRHATT